MDIADDSGLKLAAVDAKDRGSSATLDSLLEVADAGVRQVVSLQREILADLVPARGVINTKLESSRLIALSLNCGQRQSGAADTNRHHAEPS